VVLQTPQVTGQLIMEDTIPVGYGCIFTGTGGLQCQHEYACVSRHCIKCVNNRDVGLI